MLLIIELNQSFYMRNLPMTQLVSRRWQMLLWGMFWSCSSWAIAGLSTSRWQDPRVSWCSSCSTSVKVDKYFVHVVHLEQGYPSRISKILSGPIEYWIRDVHVGLLKLQYGIQFMDHWINLPIRISYYDKFVMRILFTLLLNNI